jgi:hypothetical protein
MAIVVADMPMSVDGFIADRNDEVGPLFDWYRDGPITTPSADERWSFHTDEAIRAAENSRGRTPNTRELRSSRASLKGS